MLSMLALASLLTLATVISDGATSVTAQEARPKPDKPSVSLAQAPRFHNEPISVVLEWAVREASMTCMVSEGALTDPTTSKPRRVSYDGGGALLEPAQRTLLVFEILRTVGLVAMPVVGMPMGTYTVMPIADAAGAGSVETHIEDLEGLYFGSLSLSAVTITLDELEALVRRIATPGAAVSVFKPTSKLLVADFVDTLQSIWDAHMEAQAITDRDDDVITEFARPVTHEPRGMVLALNAARHADEDCTVSLHDQSGTLVFTGQRLHVARALDRFDALEEQVALPKSQRTINLYSARILDAEVLALATRGFFAAEIARGTARIGEVLSRGQLMIESTESDWARIQTFLTEIDVPARSVEEATKDEAWKTLRDAERRASSKPTEKSTEKPESKPARPEPPAPPPTE